MVIFSEFLNKEWSYNLHDSVCFSNNHRLDYEIVKSWYGFLLDDRTSERLLSENLSLRLHHKLKAQTE